MLFGHTYRIRFRLSGGREGTCTLEARFVSAEELVDYAKQAIAVELGTSADKVTIIAIV